MSAAAPRTRSFPLPAASPRVVAWRCGSALLGLLLVGCANLPTERVADPEAAWAAHRAALSALGRWTAFGRIAIDTGADAVNLSVRWHQDGDEYRIRFNAPLGQGAAEIWGGPDQVILRTSRDEQWSASDPETLLEHRLGWWIPLRGLRHWMVGAAAPGPGAGIGLDPAGRLAWLRQSDWEVRYARYRSVEGLDLPELIELAHPRVKVRVSVSRWEIGS